MLRQIEWEAQSGHITMNEALPVFFFFFEILLQCKNLLRVDLMYNYPNVHIHTFRKHWSSIWGCFSLWVSLKQIEMFSHLQQN